MQQIVREMKIIPELPSEKPQDVNPLLKVEFPEAGGILTYMGKHEYPFKGFPYFEFVDKIDYIKKSLRGTLSSFFHSLKARPKWQLIFLASVPWLFGDFMQSQLYTYHRMVERFRIKPERYCDAIRELHRSMSTEREELLSKRENRIRLRDLACMFLEFDNAYRFRFQDIIVELDKEALSANAVKEILRLTELMISREQTQEIKDTWSLLKFYLPWYLRFNSELRESITFVLTELNLQAVALSIEDEHYCKERKDYKFKFQL